MLKFGRTYNLEVSGVDGSRIDISNPFTIEFSVRRIMNQTTNDCNIKLYNLAPQTRNILFLDYYDVENYKNLILRAGYGKTDPIIFQGNIKYSRSYRDGGSTNFITEIDVQDGGWDYVNGVFQQTYAENTEKNEVINDLINSFTFIRTGAVSNFPGTYPRGKVIDNKTVYVLQTESGNRFFTDLEIAYVLKEGDYIDGDILVISSATGLLGSPRRSDTYVIVEMLFEPRLKLGQLVEVFSETASIYNGIYQVQGIEHYGIISDAVNGLCKTRVSLYIGGIGFNTMLTTRDFQSAGN